MFEKVKTWLKENGVVGFASIIVAGVAMFLGMWFVAGCSFCFFLGKNWEIVRKLWNEKYKEKVEDIIDDIKNKVKK
jgi:hypothetical protein